MGKADLYLSYCFEHTVHVVSRQISKMEHIHTDLTALLALCEKADNDIRSCLNTLQVTYFFRSLFICGITFFNLSVWHYLYLFTAAAAESLQSMFSNVNVTKRSDLTVSIDTLDFKPKQWQFFSC
jgi:hypothetical protein